MNDNIIIVGAGPTGLTLGCLLQSQGINCVILEKEQQQNQLTKAVMVHAASLDVFSLLEIDQAVLQKGLKQNSIRFNIQGKEEYVMDFTQLSPNKFPFFINIKQPDLVDILERKFTSLGGRVYYHHDVYQIGENGTVLAKNGDEDVEFIGSYIVGCDGAKSTVRKLAQIEYKGITYPYSYVLVEGVPRQSFPLDESQMHISENGAISVIPMGDNVFRVAGPGPRQDVGDLINIEDFKKIMASIGMGEFADFKKITSLRSYKVNERMAETLVKDRVVLCGDAGHIHSPTGGQAMNLGIADAFCLYWRFAQTDISQRQALLREYTEERLTLAKYTVVRTKLNPLIQKMNSGKVSKQELKKIMLSFSQTAHAIQVNSEKSLQTKSLKTGARIPNLRWHDTTTWRELSGKTYTEIIPTGHGIGNILADYFEQSVPCKIRFRQDFIISSVEML
ncbi:hypothetical protein BOO29_15715 [Vibrio navarrensis]|uniref:FAD-dependent oxidoreductase n=1 Tax=Vibrio navarrensis TaxID=29495 RepID=UPI001869D013|nr:NAD(P)/FAD-dependent oxidoreductase [Vibrio navarrensis]MBE4586377.1 hypothetical protein [Vibrio navarrensis]